jgi:hypothetical protein
LDLTAIELAVAHQVMKRVTMVVALFTDLPQAALEILTRKQGSQSLTSIPS